MCGIFLYKSESDIQATRVVHEGLKDLEYRGYDSWGIASIQDDSNLELQKSIGKVSEAIVKDVTSRLSVGHTRWATHGKVSKKNTHPHLSNNKEIVVVHNGIFENYAQHKEKLQKKGYTFSSDTDSEVIAVLIEEYMKQRVPLLKSVKSVLKIMQGSNAFIVVDVKTKQAVLARNGSALHLGKKNGDYYVSSDMQAVLRHTNKIYSLEDGEVLDLDTAATCTFHTVHHTNEVATIEGFAHYTLKEIFDQRETIKNAYTTNQSLPVHWFKNKKVYATGCGTAFNVSSLMTYLAAMKGIDIKNFPANEFESFKGLFDKKSILLVVSQSGETADSILAAKSMKSAGGKVLALVNNQNSTLCNLSDKVFPIFAGKEIAVASTKAFTAQVVTFMKILGIAIAPRELVQFKKFISHELSDRCKKVAARYKKSTDLYVIGKGVAYPTAQETALKIKETSYIHAEGFAAGELKHGVLALIESKVPVIVIDSEPLYEKDIESASLQIKARGGSVIGIGTKHRDFYDEYINIPHSKHLQFISATIVGQLLAYHLAVLNNLNPDKPRNLAKSVTVK